ncbi:MAG TPA: methylated-DNA--[protein]-cysteine S-methyltransferase [Stellaceae bacterium]|nr:methylated-DNA--[protein]-cysteine S-methyltransferase [Stellaceae bacterium]
MEHLSIEEMPSPVGTIVLVSDDRALVALDFGDYDARMTRLLATRLGSVSLVAGKAASNAARRLTDYLAGDITAVDGLAVRTGGTPFQRIVWAALRTIPAGGTLSYGALAQRIGRPTASRAVGLANSLNPVAIVVPCHRVIGAKGQLTGYAGGLERKRWLLDHERRQTDLFAPTPPADMAVAMAGQSA